MIRENINILGKERIGELNWKNKPRFDEGCSKLLDQRKQATGISEQCKMWSQQAFQE
jgi:hypothetical protein